MNVDDLMSAATSRFAQLQGGYRQSKEAAERSVAHWTWASGPLREPVPLAAERSGMKRGRPLDMQPTTLAGAFQYGLDGAGRVKVVRELLGDGRMYEEFFIDGDSVLERARFGYAPDHDLIAVTLYSMEDDRPVKAASQGRDGWRTESYEYTGERPARIVVTEGSAGAAGEMHEVLAEYDDLGVLTRARTVFPNGYSRVVFQQPTGKRTPAALASLVRDRLVAAVPRAVSRLELDSPVYAVVLAYDPEDATSLPPLIGVATEAERAAWIADHGLPAAARYIWNPAEYDHFDEPALLLDQPDLLIACGQLAGALSGREDAPRFVRRLLNDVASALNQMAWMRFADTTSDFVVFAADLEGADVTRNIKAVVSPERLDALRAARML